MDYMLEKTENKTVSDIKESKKMQNLEKLSGMELKNIKEELIRQRDIMSKKLKRRTEINKKMAEEKKYSYKTIQKEGNKLIDNCNELRKKAKNLKMQIGICKKRGNVISEEMSESLFRNKQLYQQMQKIKEENQFEQEEQTSELNKKYGLPLAHYQKLKKKPPKFKREMEQSGPELPEDSKFWV